ncbi:MAG TPA: FG-GAP-like repeat-containing protein [Bryobacteraceae bacterium]|nr:FG-GAP-like repeat-containing protein [Bryobacteraceae bacterium]
MPRHNSAKTFTLLASVIFCSALWAQTNPVPFINNSPVPEAAEPGTPGLTLTVNGTGFVSGATVNWNATPRSTVFVNSSRLTATILASDLINPGTVSVTATNPAPGGGTSNPALFQITVPTQTVAFGNSSTYPAPGVGSILTADLNGDGHLDLIVGNVSNGQISVLLGAGDGTFGPPQVFSVGSLGPVMIALGDFDNDGKMDVVAINRGVDQPPYLSILIGKGDGTFQPYQSFPLDMSPTSLTTGDFNADGKLDVAVSICSPQNSQPCSTAPSMSILLGNGDGTFQPAIESAAGPSVQQAVTGDFNGDGRLDLAVSGLINGSSNQQIGILFGNGDGSFQTPSLLYGPYHYLAAADLNQDGILDLAAVGGNTVSILVGKGSGAFKPRVSYIAGHYLVSITVGDFNGDGHLDLVVLDSLQSNVFISTIYVLLGNGDGTFGSPIEIPTPQIPRNQFGLLATGDFNGDGRLDLTSVQSNGSGGTYNVLATYLQTALSVNPPALTFPLTLGATDSASQTLTVTNLGTTALSISQVSITGTNAADFALAGGSCMGAVLQASGSCQISVLFRPTAGGLRNASVSLTDTALASPQQVLLSGAATFLSVTPNVLHFGTLNVGTTSAPQTVTLTNTGASKISLGEIGVAGADPNDYLEQNTCGSAMLAAGASCTIAIKFIPAASGARTALLWVRDVAADETRTFVLTGTGASVSQPAVVNLSPSSGTGLTQIFSAVYSDTNGAADVKDLIVLFNTTTTLAKACAITYVPATNRLHLYDDAGVQPSAGVMPGSSAQVSNSQCTLSGAGSSFTASAGKFTLNVALAFSGTFAGQQNVYLDAAGESSNTGFVLKGTWTPSLTPPTVVSFSPNSGAGLTQIFTAVYSDLNGPSDLNYVMVLFNTSTVLANACAITYVPSRNMFHLYDDTGTMTSVGVAPGSSAQVSNSQCTLSGAGSSAASSGGTLTLNIAITFSGTFVGQKNVFLNAAGATLNSGWVKKGVWTP